MFPYRYCNVKNLPYSYNCQKVTISPRIENLPHGESVIGGDIPVGLGWQSAIVGRFLLSDKVPLCEISLLVGKVLVWEISLLGGKVSMWEISSRNL